MPSWHEMKVTYSVSLSHQLPQASTGLLIVAEVYRSAEFYSKFYPPIDKILCKIFEIIDLKCKRHITFFCVNLPCMDLEYIIIVELFDISFL